MTRTIVVLPTYNEAENLPLIVPDGCLMRVGFEERPSNVGEVFVFDDSIEHEARNDSDELRVVLIFDVWNPQLSTQDRQVVNALASAARAYGQPQPAAAQA